MRGNFRPMKAPGRRGITPFQLQHWLGHSRLITTRIYEYRASATPDA